MLRHPDSLDAGEQAKLTEALARCPHLDAAAAHVAAFAEMMTGRRGERPGAWIAAVDDDDLPDLHSFTTGLKHDHDAVLAGLTLEHSSGAVEGNVNRIILWNLACHGYLCLPCRTGVGHTSVACLRVFRGKDRHWLSLPWQLTSFQAFPARSAGAGAAVCSPWGRGRARPAAGRAAGWRCRQGGIPARHAALRGQVL